MLSLEGQGFPQSSPASPWKNPSFPPLLFRLTQYWVNPSKRGGMDGVSQGLAGLLRGIY